MANTAYSSGFISRHFANVYFDVFSNANVRTPCFIEPYKFQIFVLLANNTIRAETLVVDLKKNSVRCVEFANLDRVSFFLDLQAIKSFDNDRFWVDIVTIFQFCLWQEFDCILYLILYSFSIESLFQQSSGISVQQTFKNFVLELLVEILLFHIHFPSDTTKKKKTFRICSAQIEHWMNNTALSILKFCCENTGIILR